MAGAAHSYNKIMAAKIWPKKCFHIPRYHKKEKSYNPFCPKAEAKIDKFVNLNEDSLVRVEVLENNDVLSEYSSCDSYDLESSSSKPSMIEFHFFSTNLVKSIHSKYCLKIYNNLNL